MLMRRTIRISLAFLVSSTGAIAAPSDQPASHDPGREHAAKSQCTAQRTSSRARSAHHARATRRHLVAHHDDAALDPPSTSPHLSGGREIGTAAWYNHVGSPTSSGERLDTVTPTAAHRTLPLSSYVRVTNLDGRRSVIVKINDRGPWTRRFIIDLSPRAADEIGMRRAGVAAVMVEPIVAPMPARL